MIDALKPFATVIRQSTVLSQNSRTKVDGGVAPSKNVQFDNLAGMNLRQAGSSINITIDEDTRKPVIKVIDAHGELVRQIPPEEMLEISKALMKLSEEGEAKGVVVNAKS